MKTSTRVLLTISAVLVVVGIGLVVVALGMKHWNFSALNGRKFETNTYEFSDDFTVISLDTDTADITFALSNDGRCKVECYEPQKEKHSVSVTKGTLSVSYKDNREWYEKIALFSMTSPKITVYLPKAELEKLTVKEHTGDITIPKDFTFGNISVKASTGDVECSASVTGTLDINLSTGDLSLKDMSAGELKLTTTTGKMKLTDVTTGKITMKVSTGKSVLKNVSCEQLDSTGSTGDISLENVIIRNLLKIKRSTGDVTFNGSDAGEITIKTDTGNVKGTLLTEKIFYTKSDTGKIDVPKTMLGGRCDVETDTGDIKLKIK